VNGQLCRALETAIVVCYWRPFSKSNKVGTIGHKWKTLTEAPNLHKEMRRLRNEVYAHTDITGAREVVDVGKMLGEASAWTEGWQAIRREALPNIRELARRLEEELAAAVSERIRALEAGAGHGVGLPAYVMKSA
jgi:hypothetical protein